MRPSSKVSWGISVSALIALTFCFSETRAAGGVVINEVMWDSTEYVELFNPGDSEVSLADWTLTRQQSGGEEKTSVTFASEDVISAAGYFLLEKKEEATTVAANKIASGLTLVNTGELVRLKDSGGNVVDSANRFGAWYAGKDTTEGEAMERGDSTSDGAQEDSWHTSLSSIGGRVGTPGEINSVVPENEAPVVALSVIGDEVAINEVVSFSAEDSADPNGDSLTYQWDFGDGATGSGSTTSHVYTIAGAKTVTLTVNDGELTDTASVTMIISTPSYSSNVVVNEFLPDPVGSDTTAEFIELWNTGGELVDLGAWKLDDADGGSSAYVIPVGTTIPAGGYLLLTRFVTKIALNNAGDSVRLLDPAGSVKTSTSYADSSEGQSWNRTDAGTYEQSTTVTSGMPNIITKPPVEKEADEGKATPTPTPKSTPKPSTGGKVAGASVKAVALKDIRKEAEGTVVTVEGVVSAPPGVLGKGVLYLAGSGVQVYFSEEDFPDFALGDTVKVTGEIGSYLGETRLKLAAATDATKTKTAEAPLPHEVKTGEVGEDLEGFLVVVIGKVVETSGDTFYVDDGSGQVKVFIKESTGIEKPKMKKGDTVTIIGVVSQTTTGYRILPRFQEDVHLGAVLGLKTFPKTGLRQYGPQAGQNLIALFLALAALGLPLARQRGSVAA